MKKIIYLILVLFLSPTLMAIDGVVLVLETPLFHEPSLEAPIVQYVRKGEIIFVHNRNAPPPINEQMPEELIQLEEGDPGDFYTTLSRNGQTAYIQKQHVKLIYNDEREKLTAISPFKHDPTDYRLSEPLPENYPLHKPSIYQSSIAIGLGPAPKVNYPYTTAVAQDSFSTRWAIRTHYARRIFFDQTERFYFGGSLSFDNFQDQFELQYHTTTSEKHYQLGLGPHISYLAYRGELFQVSFFGEILLKLHWAKVSQIHPMTDYQFDRTFKGVYPHPRVGTIFMKEVLKKINLMIKCEMEGHLAYNLTSSSPKQGSDVLWQTGKEDRIHYPLNAQFSVLFGVMAYQ